MHQESSLIFLSVSEIAPNPNQPRLRINDEKLQALAENIKLLGVLQPVLVCQHHGMHTLVAGHRRLAAAVLAGLQEIPAICLPAGLMERTGAEISENMQRQDLNAIEIAMGLGKLAHMGVDRKALCEISGLSSSSLSELLRINMIPTDVLESCIRNGHTAKRFLIQLSRCGSAKESVSAYRYFLDHQQLPDRKKRDYAQKKALKNVQKLLNQLNSSLKNDAAIDYSDDSKDADAIRNEICELLQNLRKHGWFVPRQFDASNQG